MLTFIIFSTLCITFVLSFIYKDEFRHGNYEGLITTIAAPIIYCVFAYTLTGVFYIAQANTQCLKLGWRDAKIDYLFNQYCVARTDQTDIVVPLEEATKR